VADGLVEKGHVHATSIKSWVAAVDRRYKDFSCRMEKHRVKLETTLGLTHDVSLSVPGCLCVVNVHYWAVASLYPVLQRPDSLQPMSLSESCLKVCHQSLPFPPLRLCVQITLLYLHDIT